MLGEADLVFVFRRLEAAHEAVTRLESAGVGVKSVRIDPDVESYGLGSVYPGAPCALAVKLEAQEDETRVCELLRGNGRLVPVPARESQRLSLEVERLRTESLLRSSEDDLPIAVAAAATFHRVHRPAGAHISRKEYDGALNLAASLLSRLVAVYTIAAATQRRVQVPVNLATHRFVHAATQLQSRDGTGAQEKLFVRRSELLGAISEIKRAGVFRLTPPG